jgi:hypothetical protein
MTLKQDKYAQLRKWISITLLAIGIGSLETIPEATGRTRSQSSSPIRVYVFDMGRLKSANPQPCFSGELL